MAVHPGQLRFLILWYLIGPNGRWVYRSGIKRGAKGTGKDPFGAALCLIELLGPARFDGWADGSPVGVPHRMPLVQIGSNSEAQSKDVLRVANAMISGPARVHYRMDPGETRTTVWPHGRLEVLTLSEKSSEGDPATFIMLNETHHMTDANGGQRLANVARRNVGKSPADLQARLAEFTNAHQRGNESVAERSFDAWQLQAAGKSRRSDILYDSIEAPPGSTSPTTPPGPPGSAPRTSTPPGSTSNGSRTKCWIRGSPSPTRSGITSTASQPPRTPGSSLTYSPPSPTPRRSWSTATGSPCSSTVPNRRTRQL